MRADPSRGAGFCTARGSHQLFLTSRRSLVRAQHRPLLPPPRGANRRRHALTVWPTSGESCPVESKAPVAVIGAGGSGLLTAAALRRAGIAFEVLEARDGVGGTWRIDEDGDGSACYESLVANTSKLRMSVGRRRIPGKPWQYAGHREMCAYLERFADDEDLRSAIRLNWRVESARP